MEEDGTEIVSRGGMAWGQGDICQAKEFGFYSRGHGINGKEQGFKAGFVF